MRPSGARCAFPAIIVFQPDDVVEVRRRYFDQFDFADGDEAVDGAREDVQALERRQANHPQAIAFAKLDREHAALDEDRLVLDAVELTGKAMPGRDVEQFPDILIRLGEDEFVAPRLFDAKRSVGKAGRD